MTQKKIARRTFLRTTAQAIAAFPLLPSIAAEAQMPTARAEKTSNTSSKPTLILNVRDFGVTGNGKTKDTSGLQLALDRCSVLGGGEVVIPPGDYLTGTLSIRSNTTVRLDSAATLLGSPDLADYPITEVRWEGRWIKGYLGLISSIDANNIGIAGSGKIVGNAAIKGRVDHATGLRHPALLEFINCKNIRVEDCITQQNDMWSIHPTYCENITFSRVTVNSGADGIDVDSCKQVVIDHCIFATADDCISLKSGRGAEGNTIARPTEDVHISNCTFHDLRWACIGIGSETSGGIRNVHVAHCRCLSAGTFAIYIKSRPGRGAFIENIYMNDLEVSRARQGFLRINTLDSGKQDEFPVPGYAGIPSIRNFRFSNIRVSSVPTLVDAVDIPSSKPLEGFRLANITGTCNQGMFLANMRNVTLRNIDVTGFTGHLLHTDNVTGTGLTGAVPMPAAKRTEPVPAPSQPYSLH
jgi:polygalacturonase